MFCPEFCELFCRTPILQRIYEWLVLKHQCWGLSLKRCKPDGLNAFNSIRKKPLEVFCRRRFSVGEGVLRYFVKFTGNTSARVSFFNKVADLRPAILLKKRLWHRRFPVNFAKFSKTPFLQNTSGQLLL